MIDYPSRTKKIDCRELQIDLVYLFVIDRAFIKLSMLLNFSDQQSRLIALIICVRGTLGVPSACVSLTRMWTQLRYRILLSERNTTENTKYARREFNNGSDNWGIKDRVICRGAIDWGTEADAFIAQGRVFKGLWKWFVKIIYARKSNAT